MKASVDKQANVKIEFNSQAEAILSPDRKWKLLPCDTCGALEWMRLNTCSFQCDSCHVTGAIERGEAQAIVEKPVNPAASALGQLSAGKPKHYSDEELAKRTERLAKARAKRAADRESDRNARLIDSGYQAYAREEGHYDSGGDC